MSGNGDGASYVFKLYISTIFVILALARVSVKKFNFLALNSVAVREWCSSSGYIDAQKVGPFCNDGFGCTPTIDNSF